MYLLRYRKEDDIMGVVLQIMTDLLTTYGINPGIIDGIVAIIYASTFIGIVYNVCMTMSRVIAIYNVCRDFFTNLRLQCKKPPKSVGSEIDGSNNSLN